VSQPEKPWIVFSAAVREMVGPTLDTNQKAIAARADQSDQMVEKLRNQVGELAEAQRQVARQLEELRKKQNDLFEQQSAIPPPRVQGRVDGSFAQLYEFNDWLGKAILAQEDHAHRTAAALQDENRRLQSRIDSLERRLDGRRRSPWLLGAALPATVAILALILYLVM
jgi:chromosome segregation ATPase